MKPDRDVVALHSNHGELSAVQERQPQTGVFRLGSNDISDLDDVGSDWVPHRQSRVIDPQGQPNRGDPSDRGADGSEGES